MQRDRGQPRIEICSKGGGRARHAHKRVSLGKHVNTFRAKRTVAIPTLCFVRDRMLALREPLIAHPGPTTDRVQISVMVFLC